MLSILGHPQDWFKWWISLCYWPALVFQFGDGWLTIVWQASFISEIWLEGSVYSVFSEADYRVHSAPILKPQGY